LIVIETVARYVLFALRAQEPRIYFPDRRYGGGLSPGHWKEDGIISTESERELARPFERCRRVQLVRQ